MDSSQTSTPGTERKRSDRGSMTGGIVLIIIGLLFLGERFLPDFRFADYWPLILVAIGIGMIWKSWKPQQP
jgi:phage shock protein C